MFVEIKIICKFQITHSDYGEVLNSLLQNDITLSLSFTTTLLFTLVMQNYRYENIPPKVEVADENRPRPTKKTPRV
jgi:hypothetical protein